MPVANLDAMPIPSNVATLTGPLLISHLFNWGLFGVLCIQVYLYYISFPQDRTLPKVVVGFTFVIETLQLVLYTRDAFRILGSGWGNVDALDTVGWQWFSIVIMTVFIASMNQFFYAWRIWVLGGKAWLPIIVLLLSLTQLVAGVYGGIVTTQHKRYSLLQDSAFVETTIWLVGTATCDITIASTMLYYLRQQHSNFKSTSTLLTKIIRVTIETGVICAAFAIIDIALFMSFRNNNIHLPLCSTLSKVYSNSLLAVLNTRIRIVGGRNEQPVADSSLSMLSDGGETSFSSHTSPRFPRISAYPVSGKDRQNPFDGTALMPIMITKESVKCDM